jgi:phospholipid transport system substrate-binding protein
LEEKQMLVGFVTVSTYNEPSYRESGSPMSRPRSVLTSFLVLFFCMVNGTSLLAKVESGPKVLIQDRHHRIVLALEKFKSSSVAAVRDEIRTVLVSFVDFDRIAQTAFKKYFPTLSSKQKARYTASFKALVQATYLKRIRPGLEHKMTFREEVEIIGDKARVPTTFRRGESEADVDYLLFTTENGEWRAYDLVIDEVSMARNYRREFYRIYKRDGFGALLKKIEERTKTKNNL